MIVIALAVLLFVLIVSRQWRKWFCAVPFGSPMCLSLIHLKTYLPGQLYHEMVICVIILELWVFRRGEEIEVDFTVY